MLISMITTSLKSFFKEMKTSCHELSVVFLGVLFMIAIGSTSPVYAAFPGQNGLIIYNNSDGAASVSSDGTGFRQITNAQSESEIYTPSKDGTKIIYSTEDSNTCPDTNMPYTGCSVYVAATDRKSTRLNSSH